MAVMAAHMGTANMLRHRLSGMVHVLVQPIVAKAERRHAARQEGLQVVAQLRMAARVGS